MWTNLHKLILTIQEEEREEREDYYEQFTDKDLPDADHLYAIAWRAWNEIQRYHLIINTLTGSTHLG